jgi:hypothetical protein
MIQFFRRIRLRLLSENSTDSSIRAGRLSKYFLYAIGEIILVVIGILIALQINNWNQDRKSALQETVYLSRLLSENKQDISAFSGFIADLEKGNESVENLSSALKNPNIKDSLLILGANNYFKYGSIYPIFTSSTSTFDDLSSTGNLTIISNVSLRDSIVQHYAKHKQVAERIQIGVNWALPLDMPFTFANDIMKFEPSTAFLFPEQSGQLLAEELKKNKLQYISNAAAHYWINNDAIDQLKILIQDTLVLISKLENELKNR